MTTQDKNKLIAEFMGAKYSNYTDNTKGVILPNIGVIREGVKGLKYHTSWDWLMSVVEKIEELNFEVQIGGGTCCLIQGLDLPLIDVGGGDYDRISATFEAVIQFIQWYNENKKP